MDADFYGGQMWDALFPFIDPILEPTEEDLSHFIAHLDTSLAPAEREGRKPIKLAHPLSEETFKQMWMLRYQQHMGNLTFLELLDKYEEILGIPPHTSSE